MGESLMPYEPTLTAYTDEAPCPRVEVFFPSFHPDTATVTVYRTVGARQYEVRGAVRAVTAGALTRIDFECPFNTVVTYRAEMFDVAGMSLGFTDPGSLGDIYEGLAPDVDLAPAEDLAPSLDLVGTGLRSQWTWLHNPLDPQGAVKVRLAADSGRSISRPVPTTWSRPRGRRGAVALSEPRGGVEGVRFVVRTTDLETADKVQALLGDEDRGGVPVICVRVGSRDEPLRVPRPLFFGTDDIVEVDVAAHVGITRQEMEGQEATPPVPGLFVPLLTNADLKAYYATNAALIADNLTNADVSRRYDLAGYAAG
jgi:hypothetical protein